MSGFPSTPIAIISFNRPDYLRQVLESLSRQEGANLRSRKIVLFQDGAYNQYSGRRRTDDALIEANKRVFNEIIPYGEIRDSSKNIGVALNFDRAERWAFEELGAEGAIFLEDDMVLAPTYIRSLDDMLSIAREDSRIGYVAAWGNWVLSPEEQRAAPGRLITLAQHWAFGLTKRQWLLNKPFIDQYISILSDTDYYERDEERILDLYSKYGLARIGGTQDRAKANATMLSGCIRVNTTACLAKYIGMKGQHFTENLFKSMLFENTQVYRGETFAIEKLTEARFEQLLQEQRKVLHIQPPLLSLGKRVSFEVYGHGLGALRDGFHSPEKWGVWANSKRCIMEVRVSPDELTRASALELEARLFLPPKLPSADVRVLINGQCAGAISLTRDMVRVRLEFSSGLPHDSKWTICIESPFIGSPREFGNSPDPRQLTVGIAALTLLPVDR